MAKETMDVTSIIKTLIATVGVVFVFIAFGTKLGRAEKSIETLCATVTSVTAKQESTEKDVGEIKTEQAYQKGVIETKLTNLEKTVDEIKAMLSQWEADDAEN